MKICLVASSGGHLMELYAIKEAWQAYDRFWVTFPTHDVKSLLGNDNVYWAHYPTNRNIPNLIRNTRLACSILRRERPNMIISTGAGVGVPFIFVGWLFKIPTVFIESITFTNKLSLTGRLIYHIVDHYYVQWPDIVQKFPKVVYQGQVL